VLRLVLRLVLELELELAQLVVPRPPALLALVPLPRTPPLVPPTPHLALALRPPRPLVLASTLLQLPLVSPSPSLALPSLSSKCGAWRSLDRLVFEWDTFFLNSYLITCLVCVAVFTANTIVPCEYL
jgi:hypothetical protein